MSGWRALLVCGVVVSLLAAPAMAGAADPRASDGPSPAGPGSEPVGPVHPLVGGISPLSEPTGSVEIVSGYWWHSVGQIIIVGEVTNGMSTRRKLVKVQTKYRNGNGTVVGSVSSYVLLDRLAPGMTSPFLIVDGPDGLPPGVEDVDVSVTSGQAVTSGEAPRGGLLVTVGPPSLVGEWLRYTGTVKNMASFAVGAIEVEVTLYNADGDVRNVTYVPSEVDILAPGASSSFTADLPPLKGSARVGIAAQARSESVSSTYVTSWNNYFDDIGFTAFRSDIIWNAEQEIASGCGTARYCPSGYVTREQMASFLARALKLSGTAPDAFTDDESSIHEPNINLVAKAGIATGCAPGKYCPTGLVSREQMASFLARALKLAGSAPDAFTDDEQSIHEPNINLVAREGVATGCGNNRYCPTANVTRGQMAAFLHRAFGP